MVALVKNLMQLLIVDERRLFVGHQRQLRGTRGSGGVAIDSRRIQRACRATDSPQLPRSELRFLLIFFELTQL